MQAWRKFASLSIYPKLVLTFLLVLSPMYIIGWRMNSEGSKTVEKEITDSLQSRTSMYMNMLEFDLGRVISLLQEYLNDDDLLKLTSSSEVMTEIEKMQAQLGLKKRLDILKRSSKFVENASAFIPVMNRTISANDNIFTALDRDQMQALTQSTNRFESPFLVWHDRIFISLPYPDPAVSSSKEPVFLLTVEISKRELAEELNKLTSEGGGAVLSGNRIPWTVSGTGHEEEGAQILHEIAGLNGRAAAETPSAETPSAEAPSVDAPSVDALSADPPPADSPDEPAIRSVKLGDLPYTVVSQPSSSLGMTLYMYLPSKRVNASLDTYRSWFNALSLVMVVVVLLFAYMIYLIIHQPLKKLVRSFRRVEQGHFDQEVHYSLRDEFGYLYSQFNGMVKRLNVLVHEVYEQQFRARSAELRHLQAQINPHFLYNSYFILYRMAMLNDNDNIVYFTKHLGEYFEYITRDGMEDVPLGSEVKHARTYAEIQSFRFAGRIRVEFGDPPESAADLPVPRLILQPLIENCYNHGLTDKGKGGWIRVTFERRDRAVLICVEDNGGEMDAAKLLDMQTLLLEREQPPERCGLVNIHRRLRIQYGEPGGMTLEIGEEKGLKVTMILPETPAKPGTGSEPVRIAANRPPVIPAGSV
ncbi:sensor histidine kinase [Cohnella zeiphila]|uniref:Histidine kinase n=1 Tax=Cohnella zeiphila TaxID=2761120 RepID=A0A7X0VTR1_9BACL|nr:histidine kinase [Cohnella zeiphila]MBB6730179.1 histidine kinase [Cohnella zeiphila]